MITEQFSAQRKAAIKDIMLGSGIAYPIPPRKLARRNELGYEPREVTVNGRQFQGDTMSVHGLASPEMFGLTHDRISTFSRLVSSTARLGENLHNDPYLYPVLGSLIHNVTKPSIEYDYPHAGTLYPDGSLARLDLVMTGDPQNPLSVCDINLIPQLYAISRGALEAVGQIDSLPASADVYVQTLAAQPMEEKNGIFTSYTSPWWPSQHWVSQRVAAASQESFGIVSKTEYDAEPVFGTLLRHRRGIVGTKAHNLIYPHGSRLAETHLLGAIATLPGIEQYLPPNGYGALWDMQEACAPSVLVKMDEGGNVILADKINSDGEISWGEPGDSLRSFVQPGKRLSAVVKSPATTGSKGVRTVSARSVGELRRNIGSQIDHMSEATGIAGNQAFVLQPRYPSKLDVSGETMRTKIDVFFVKTEGEWVLAGGHAYVAPLNHQLVHGTGETEIVVIPELWQNQGALVNHQM